MKIANSVIKMTDFILSLHTITKPVYYDTF